MKKIFTKVFSILGITLLMASVTACGNKQADQSKNSSVKTSKVKKSKNKVNKNLNNKKNKKSSSSQENQDSSDSSTQSSISKKNSSSLEKENSQEEIQLGLGDVATWTDENGITHHVDSDGMDRQTTSGSSQVTYKDWSGSLPSNAQVIHQN